MTDFVQKYGRWAVIAGASEGVGASLADQLATRGLDLVLIARNGPLLEEVAARVREEHGVRRASSSKISPIPKWVPRWPRRRMASTSGC